MFKESRLHPTIFNSRWYSLKLLANEIKLFANNLSKRGNNLRLLDYGCGDKPYKELFNNVIDQYIGADLPFNNIAELTVTDDGKINCEDNTADIVLSTQVLEHVIDPSTYLSECHRVLKRDGELVLSTHGYWIFHPDPTDYWRWTSDGLKKILNDHNFEIKYFRGIVGRPAMGFQLIQDSLIFKVPRFFIPIISIPFQFLMYLSDLLLTRQNTRDKDAGIFFIICKPIK
ncbi:MAG: class I SAM-dependent methyltransferase [Bacteroidetes bacterium]|nr:class I SAM-dependent methyltransferase [Bacteroidota bacterium]